MTVGELRDRLQAHPSDIPVRVLVDERAYELDAVTVGVSSDDITLRVGEPSSDRAAWPEDDGP